MKELRRELHKIPELGFKEYKTKEFILNKLEDKGLEIINIGETGLGVYFSFNKAKTICFRCEMDALPLEEENEVEYKSIHKGISHSCGHDGHMAILLSIIDDLSNKKIEPNVNVLFIFQPSEESFGGSLQVINSKILDKYKVEEIYALHIWPNLPKGKIFTRNQLLSKPTEIDILVKGKSAHVGNKLEGKDALEIGINLLTQINLKVKQIEDSIVHFGVIESGNQRNIVSDKFIAKGTIRTFNDKALKDIISIINRLINDYSKKYDASILLNVNSSYPALINDEELVNDVLKLGIKLLKYPYYQGEDFSLYLEKIKGVYFLLGGGNIPPLHSPNFDFDEEILNSGKELFVKLLNKN